MTIPPPPPPSSVARAPVASSGFRLSFGAEELALLVQSLGGDTLMGLGESPLAALAPDEEKRIAQAATHSLLARGYLVPLTHDKVGIEDTVRKIITIALHPLHIVTQIRRAAGRVLTLFHYLGPEHITIAHQTQLGAHFLDVTFQWPDFPTLIFEEAAPYLASSGRGETVLLPTHDAQRIRSFIHQQAKAEAASLLFQYAISRNDAMQFLDALAHPTMTWYIHVASWQGKGFHPYENALTLLCNSQNCWGVRGESGGDASDMTTIQKLTPAMLKDTLQQLFALF